MRRTLRRPARAGFTLIELVIVIAIIAVLLSLLGAGVQAARGTALRTQARADINNFNSSLRALMSKMPSNNPLPSKVVLCENINDYLSGGAYANNPDAQATFVALTAIFGPRVIAKGATVDWNGDGSIAPAGTGYTLEGQAALVFWTGGIPSAPSQTPACLGFNMSQSGNPAVNPQRPAMGFSASQLVRSSNNFLVYNDSWGTPYAYFATHGAQNNYANDCPSLVGNSFVPYQTASNQYVNAESFQIISAGKDQSFGTGGIWNPQTGAVTGTNGGDMDNMTSFTQGVLGGGQ